MIQKKRRVVYDTKGESLTSIQIQELVAALDCKEKQKELSELEHIQVLLLTEGTLSVENILDMYDYGIISNLSLLMREADYELVSGALKCNLAIYKNSDYKDYIVKLGTLTFLHDLLVCNNDMNMRFNLGNSPNSTVSTNLCITDNIDDTIIYNTLLCVYYIITDYKELNANEIQQIISICTCCINSQNNTIVYRTFSLLRSLSSRSESIANSIMNNSIFSCIISKCDFFNSLVISNDISPTTNVSHGNNISSTTDENSFNSIQSLLLSFIGNMCSHQDDLCKNILSNESISLFLCKSLNNPDINIIKKTLWCFSNVFLSSNDILKSIVTDNLINCLIYILNNNYDIQREIAMCFHNLFICHQVEYGHCLLIPAVIDGFFKRLITSDPRDMLIYVDILLYIVEHCQFQTRHIILENRSLLENIAYNTELPEHLIEKGQDILNIIDTYIEMDDSVSYNNNNNNLNNNNLNNNNLNNNNLNNNNLNNNNLNNNNPHNNNKKQNTLFNYFSRV
ncbi:hypothetical protein WA158_001305 [Blastocystis sp. Blastoise]